MTSLSSKTCHASCVAIKGRAVLISGKSGSGKSDLMLRLIDRGAQLVSDDCTILSRAGSSLTASAPSTIKGKVEIRGIGIIAIDSIDGIVVALMVILDEPPERMPMDDASRSILGIAIRTLTLSGFEASAPLKVEYALRALEN